MPVLRRELPDPARVPEDAAEAGRGRAAPGGAEGLGGKGEQLEGPAAGGHSQTQPAAGEVGARHREPGGGGCCGGFMCKRTCSITYKPYW